MNLNHIATVAAVCTLWACGDSDDPMGTEVPSRPSLGAQIDRQGRAGVTTALISTLAEDGPRGQARDAYNRAPMSQWSTFADDIAANLAVYDALDTVCGNQVLAGADAVDGRYDGLAGALADDRLYVNLDATSCGQYLAVELDATGVAPNSDCGGRTPSYDVIDVTYSAFALGAVSGVTDGVPSDDGSPNPAVFPFLAAP